MKKLGMVLIANLLFGMPGVLAHELKWEALMLSAVKMQPNFDYDAHAESYMRLYRPDVWSTYRNDEFEFEDKKQETKEMMKKRVAEFPIEEEFTVYTTFTFGDYDFKNQLFPLKSLEETSYFWDSNHGYNPFSNSYQVFFANTEIMGNINMDKEEAKNFLNSKKNSGGYIDRKVGAKIQFRLTKIKKLPNQLEAELLKVTIYSDDRRTKILQEY